MATKKSGSHKRATKNVLRSKAMLCGAEQTGVRRKATVAQASKVVHEYFESNEESGSFNGNLYNRYDFKPLDAAFHQWYDHEHLTQTRQWEHGLRIIAKKGLHTWEEGFDRAKVRFDDEKMKAADRWDEILANAKNQNQRIFPLIESLYPSAEEFLSSTAMTKKIRPIPMADDLRLSLSESEVEVVREQLRKQHEEGLKDVYERLRDGLSHARKQLSTGKRLHGSVLHNIGDIVAALDGLNVPDEEGKVNEDLEDIGNRISSELLDADIDDLKKDKDLKQEKADKASELVEELEDKLKGYV